ncbi:MAG: ArsR family transcriptional regulator [Desulfofustis sp.]|nr:hypothetical protein [Desulfofustis sp.]RZW14967.1 MAG: ArsR family transcriptional regulator [Desulfobulbaceae bacterium]MBT8347370.1 hypothetical protein [Desulfofustis sp.]MBT8355268.1 hypothetical protein [Desulfofustis sp.]NNF46674.1 ArsR family transcriptional regulator [Desulfofustis sp.]
MSKVDLIDARDAFTNINNSSSVLVCAYERDDKFHRLHLEGALSLSKFQSIWSTLSKDTELIFY